MLSMPDQILCGYFDCSTFAGLSVSPERVRTLYEIEYYLEDGRSTFSDGTEYPIRRAHVLVGLPGQRCNSLLPFKTKYIKCNASGTLAERIAALPPYFPVRSSREVEHLFDGVIASQSESCDELTRAAAFFALLSHLSEEANAPRESTDPNTLVVTRAKKYVEEHLAEPVKLSDVAAAVSLSPSYFHTVFVSALNMTPHEYLTDCRVKAAMDLLSLTSLSMPEIAERCGFANQQYLGTVFKAHTGLSPAHYRKLHRRDYLV